MWNNLGQDIGRITYGKPGTLTSTCLWFSYEKDVALDGVDHMLLQGFPAHLYPEGLMSSSVLKKAAGEAYSAPEIAKFVYAYFLNEHAPWWKSDDLKA